MKHASIALVVAALLPLAVSAQEATPDAAPALSLLERSQVRQALDAARRDGGMKVFRAGYVGELTSSRSRAEVMEEVRAARASGELAALNAEAVGFAEPRAAAVPAWLAMERGR